MLRLRLLGTVDLTDQNAHPLDAALRRSKLLGVLAYLAAARPRGFHRREKVAAMFWPELSSDRARAALRVTLTRLRDVVGTDVIVSRGADDIGVDHAVLWCDIVAMRELLAAGKPLEAAALYGGAFLDGVHVEGAAAELEQWIDAERQRATDDLVRGLLASDDIAAVRRALDIAPTDDHASRRLIAMLRARGDHADALRVYDDLARRLERDLEVEPSAETTALVADLRTAKSAPASPARSRITFTPRDVLPIEIVEHPGRFTPLRIGVAAMVAAACVTAVALARPIRPVAARPINELHWMTARYGAGTIPLATIAPSAVLDSSGDGVILFGGQFFQQDIASSRLLNEVWRLRHFANGEIATWSKFDAKGAAPAARWLAGVTYDAAHDRLLLHGGARGFTSPCANDTWVLNRASGLDGPTEWREVRITGDRPPARGGIHVFYDAASRRLIYFGGHDCIREFVDDVWVLQFDDSTLSAGRWTQLHPDSSAGAPFGRSAYASFYDARANRLFIYGGYGNGVILGDSWILEHANGLGGTPSWRTFHCAGTPPPALGSSASAYDSTTDVWLLNGGSDITTTDRYETWRLVGAHDNLAGCRWDQPVIGGVHPNARQNHSGMIDPRTHDFIIVGGDYAGTAYRDVRTLTGAARR